MSRQLTSKQFIQHAKQVHGGKYNYSKTKYIKSNIKVSIICKKHGIFLQTPNNHLQGKGCLNCNKYKKLTTKTFIQKAIKTHNNKYNYSKTKYIKSNIKVIIICPEHGIFYQTPSEHLYGKGCVQCAYNKRRLTQLEFVKKAEVVHGNKYNYSKTKYIKSNIKVNIICKKHGIFKQTPHHHLRNRGCPKCCHKISKSGTKWLNEVEIQNNIKLKKEYYLNINNKKIFVDGFHKKTNTIYEYYGNYWHGNPKIYDQDEIHPVVKITFGELYQRTLEKEKLIRSAGYNLVTKWGN